ncbi:MAG: colanic acid biosynthesis glycosyltransferase WcaI, partial [Betaproteobacteria bacterium]
AGMLASGRPVIAGAARGTEIAAVVEGRGVLTEPESALGFANAILELAADESRRMALGQAGREYAERTLSTPAVFDRLHLQIARARPAARASDAAVAATQ